MSKLSELFAKVQEKNLNKTELESYRDDLTNLFASMQLELADLEKKEAIYFLEYRNMSGESEKVTDIQIKRAWRGTPLGQRLIELNRFQKATEKVLSSLKSRIYAVY